MDDAQLIAFTKKLIEFPSFEPKKNGLPRIILDEFQKQGIKYSVVEDSGIQNIVASTSSKTTIVFNGHWDTVRPFNGDAIKIKTIQSQKSIAGLGACDMKAGIASMVAAFIRCHNAQIPGVTLCLVGDEEIGGKHGTKVLVEKKITGKYIILGEPTRLQISLGQKGGVRCVLHAEGRAAHGAYPQRGDNAILKLWNVIDKILEKFPLPPTDVAPEKLFSMVTVSVNIIKGGSSENVVPHNAEAVLDIRIPPQENTERVLQILKAVATDGGVDITSEVLGLGWVLQKDNHLTKIAFEVTKKIIKKDPTFIYKMGTNDGKYYANNTNNIINIGPGDNKLSHSPHEKVLVTEILKAKDIYFDLAKNLSKNG
jgi:succinyl-diaminopimelate desuccinylase